ncbi:hypothetical protein TNCV_1433491 [Trichonephila clavipes]|nr:hypothetical protein TNCV_1433491 [Trichonephila clavipes]
MLSCKVETTNISEKPITKSPPGNTKLDFSLLTFTSKTILCGDFNAHSKRWNYSDLNSAGKVMEDLLIADQMELLYDDSDIPTYLHYNGNGTNPDLTLASADIADDVEREVICDPGSGHRMIITGIGFDTTLQQLAVRLPSIERAVILSDSTSALQALSNYNENNCLRVQNCRELLGKIKGKIVFQWVPSHCGLWANERADFLAKKGTGILQNFRRDLTLHSVKLEIKRIFRESFRLTASRVARDKPWSTLLTSPICVLCDTGQDMTAAHLDECSALNDLNCNVKRFYLDQWRKTTSKTSISLETKIAILDRLGKGEGSTAIGKHFNLGESTVRAIKKNEAAIRKSVVSGTKLNTKFASYTRDVLLERTERAIAIWIKEQIQRRIPVSSYLIQEKALQFL